MLEIKTKGFESLYKTLKTESKRQEKALNTAVKVEGFRLMRLLKKEIQSGAPGGRKFSPLTYMARARGGRLRPNKPLRRLAIAVRYQVQNNPFEMKIGWIGPRVSKSWKRIAEMQQEGFESGISESRRRYFRLKAGGLSRRSIARRYLFLKKSTRKLKTPARPIMEPFWRAQRDSAWRNIRRNYVAKLKGGIIAKGQYGMKYDYPTDTFKK
ncbi:MAG TPA: hypothetical protein VMW95_04230 [Desulfobacterales bacterium]|nr:hypothetical protein [Desulfobacterales bacterium]